jgi:predicted nucleic acid-binding protein
MTYLLDSNIVSAAMLMDRAVTSKLAELEPGSAAISALTYAEIRYGLQRMASMPMSKSRQQEMAKREELFDRLMDHFDVLAWDREAAEAFAAERIACAADGEVVDVLDLLILAHAASTRRVLVTRDAALQRRNRKGPHRAAVISW